MSIRALWKRITTTRYSRALEVDLAHVRAENALLRAENRGLLNSILGIAGVPPIPVERESLGEARVAAEGAQREGASKSNGAAVARLASPMRRRSWQQINRMLEFESAKKKSQEAV